ncbi:hypothetical protein IWX49DRAFT_205648 [Phyllosticta citricarpa]|uniref:NAD-dependent epimerase/dehydratase domain-containing protein n=2 Tax=Phyllosticta TaxID=121621 RepID=A0ABR1MFT9_9PEZI
MTRVLLTGGSGFIAAHVLDILLKHGHSVVTTVRTQQKADKIKEAHPTYGNDKLDFAIVEDIAKEDAFEDAVKSDPPFEAVIHTASPFHYNVTDPIKDLINPAVIGTTGVLKSVKKHAPTVKKIVITSSFAAIVNPSKGNWPEHTYSEADWNPATLEDATKDTMNAYRVSKTLAEKSAWDFVEKEKPNFVVATINPPMVYGPVVHYLNSLDALNTSNQRIRDAILGKWKDEIPATGGFCWVDVRDVGLAHVKAMELPAADQKRFFTTAGAYSNREMVEVIRKHFPEYQDKLPGPNTPGGGYPDEGSFKVDNSRSRTILGIQYIPFEDSIVDTVKSLKAVGA